MASIKTCPLAILTSAFIVACSAPAKMGATTVPQEKPASEPLATVDSTSTQAVEAAPTVPPKPLTAPKSCDLDPSPKAVASFRDAVREFTVDFNSRSMAKLDARLERFAWDSARATPAVTKDNGSFSTIYPLVSFGDPVKDQWIVWERITLTPLARGRFDPESCSGNGHWGIRRFTAEDLGTWVSGEVPEPIAEVAECASAFTLYKRFELVFFWGLVGGAWKVLLVRDLLPCEWLVPGVGPPRAH